jgi:hypothetical protein
MNEHPDRNSDLQLELTTGVADEGETLAWGAMQEGELDDALSFAFEASLEALDGLAQIEVRDEEAGDVVGDDHAERA